MTCTVTCQEGFAFSGAVLAQYVCGPDTGYLWPHESPDNPRALLPACTGNRRRFLQKVGKVSVGFFYSAAYAMTGPARFTISEVAVDWQDPMVLQRKLRPSNCTR